MRQRELKYGIPVLDQDENKIGTSKVSFVAARRVIAYKIIVSFETIVFTLLCGIYGGVTRQLYNHCDEHEYLCN